MCQSNLTRDAKQTGSYNELQQLMQIYRADVCQCERRITVHQTTVVDCHQAAKGSVINRNEWTL